MIRLALASTVAVALLVSTHVLSAQAGTPTMVDVGGHKLNVRVAGTARPGAPTIIFESGLGSPLAAWNGVNVTVADSSRTIAYERAGIGASELGKEPPTVKNIAAELHALLARLDAPPPYVLVGHSLGGPIINTFAATFPKEVAGLVFIDPTDFMQTDADMAAVWEKVGVKNGRDSVRTLQAKMLTGMPAGVAAEWREVDRVERGGFAEYRAAGDAPVVPMVVLLAGKGEAGPAAAGFPGDFNRFFQALMDQRIDHFGRLARRGAKGTLVLTTKSGHFIHGSEPELVVWAIRRVLAMAKPHPELDRFVGQYPFTPAFAITITRDDDKLMLQATGQQMFALAAESATTFTLQMVGAKIEFETDAAGNATALVLVQNGMRQRAPKAK
jgi:pimeloyl-ACP methyl ester carboxylesterase